MGLKYTDLNLKQINKETNKRYYKQTKKFGPKVFASL